MKGVERESTCPDLSVISGCGRLSPTPCYWLHHCTRTNRTEVRQTASFLLDCGNALHERDATEAMTPCPNRLYQVIHRVRDASPSNSDRDVRFAPLIPVQGVQRLSTYLASRCVFLSQSKVVTHRRASLSRFAVPESSFLCQKCGFFEAKHVRVSGGTSRDSQA